MATQHNTFIRKFGKYAIVITVTDWNDFKELEQYSEHEDSDFLVGAVTDSNIYTSFNPSMTISTMGEVKDITNETCGVGLSGIITGNSPSGPLWQFRKINGLMATCGFEKVKINQ